MPAPLAAQTAPDSALAGSALPQLGDSSDLTSSAERRLGDRIIRTLYRDPDYLDDPVLGDYVLGIWQPLLAAARLRGELTLELDERFAWQIVLGRDRSVNAFALPGGYFGLHLGLLAVVDSPDELASVLGHELSHVTQRHISRLISKTSQQAPWMMGAMILGALAASKNSSAGNALIVGGQALSAQSQLNFSRDMEREADRIGLGIMTQAGFDALGFVSMFDKLQQAARLNDSGSYPYLRSHPLTTERIADMRSRMPLNASYSTAVAPALLHAMMAARARVLSHTDAAARHGWQAQADDPALPTLPAAQQAGILYGAALAASHLRQDGLAQRHLAGLQKLVGSHTGAAQQVQWLALEVALAARDMARLQKLGPASGPQASQRPGLLLQAQVALQTGQPQALDQAAQGLQAWVVSHPQDALAWQWLASTQTAQHQMLRALRAEAEVHVAHFDYAGALDRLKAAQDQMRSHALSGASGGHIDASIIDTRYRQIQALLKEQALER